MKNETILLPPALRELAEKHFVLLESQNRKKKSDTIQLNLSCYDVMYLIADIVKVCMLALEGKRAVTEYRSPRQILAEC